MKKVSPYVQLLINDFAERAFNIINTYPEALEGASRTRSVEVLDYINLPLTFEDLDIIINILETEGNNSSYHIAKYVGETYFDSIEKVNLLLSKEIKKKIIQSTPLSIMKNFNKEIKVDAMLLSMVKNTFSFDIDTKEIVRTILEFHKPYVFVTAQDETKDNKGNWISTGSIRGRPLDKTTYADYYEYLYKSKGFVIGTHNKLIITDPNKKERTVYTFNTNLEDYFNKASWFGTVCTDYTELI